MSIAMKIEEDTTDQEVTIENIKTIVTKAFAEIIKRGDDPLLTREEAAKYLRIKVNTLCVWATGGRGPALTKLGSRSLYRKSSLDKFVTENTLSR